MANKPKFKLNASERSQLKSMLKKGTHKSRVLKRCMVLLKLDSGVKKSDIAVQVDVAPATVYNLKNAYEAKGLQATLYDKPKPGRPLIIDSKSRAKLTALACSDAPKGYAKWTLRLLADRAVELGIVSTISHEQVRQILKKTN